MHIDDLKHSKETEYNKQYIKKPVILFEKGWDGINLPDPPLNSSVETKKELELIAHLFAKNTKKDWERIRQQDKDKPAIENLFIEVVGIDDKLLKKFISLLTDDLFHIGTHYKRKHDRPRPCVLSKHMNINFPNIETETGISPSYPSGHALESHVIAKYLGDMFRSKKTQLKDLAEDISYNRVRGGMHYPSDIEAGKKLAEKVYPLIKVNVIKKASTNFKEWVLMHGA